MIDISSMDAGAEWEGTKAVRFQIDGQDLVSVVDIDRETGQAQVIVWTSTGSDARIAWRGAVNIAGHLAKGERPSLP